MKYEKLFSPIQIRGVTFPNRVIQSAMGTLMVGVDKKVNQRVVDFLTARAKGGVGLVYKWGTLLLLSELLHTPRCRISLLLCKRSWTSQ